VNVLHTWCGGSLALKWHLCTMLQALNPFFFTHLYIREMLLLCFWKCNKAPFKPSERPVLPLQTVQMTIFASIFYSYWKSCGWWIDASQTWMTWSEVFPAECRNITRFSGSFTLKLWLIGGVFTEQHYSVICWSFSTLLLVFLMSKLGNLLYKLQTVRQDSHVCINGLTLNVKLNSRPVALLCSWGREMRTKREEMCFSLKCRENINSNDE